METAGIVPPNVRWSRFVGQLGGVDVWLDGEDGALEIASNLVNARLPLADIGCEDTVLDAGGLRRQINVCRLPEDNPHRELRASARLDVRPDPDTAI